MSQTPTRTEPALPWWPAERAPRDEPGEPLSRARIVQAAFELIDEEGLDALSMRRLGHRLNAGATTLYWYVASKDQLLDLVVDELFGELSLDQLEGQGWRAQTESVAREFRRVILHHRNLALVLSERVTMGPKALTALEWLLTLLVEEGGFDRKSAVMVYNAVVSFTAGWAILETREPTGPLGEGLTQEEVGLAVLEMVGQLPADRFPNLIAASKDLMTMSEDDRFEYALQRLLDGIEVDRKRSGVRSS
jgi:AcrR family transcriptional regulator